MGYDLTSKKSIEMWCIDGDVQAFAEAIRAEERETLGKERDMAIAMLAEWCVAVDEGGASWDEWDKHYKDAMYGPGPLREMLDAAIAQARQS